MEFSASVTKPQADAAAAVRAQARDHIRQTAVPGTILALPSAPCIAPQIDISRRRDGGFPRARDAADLHRRAGRPAANEHSGRHDYGCPIGLSFIGWAGGDEALLDLACALSRHCGMAA